MHRGNSQAGLNLIVTRTTELLPKTEQLLLLNTYARSLEGFTVHSVNVPDTEAPNGTAFACDTEQHKSELCCTRTS